MLPRNEKVRRYYDRHVDKEWGRLERHPLEHATTWRAIEEFIPRPADILDVGGGPGRYALELARAGHTVTMADLSAANVAFAQRKAAERGVRLACLQADATNLTEFAASAFDVVLLLGPLYHLVESEERERAVCEAVRVLRDNGVIFAAFINRLPFVVDALAEDPEALAPVDERQLTKRLSDGIRLTEESGDEFPDSYSEDPQAIAPFMEGLGLQTLRVMAVEGLDLLTSPGDLSAEPFERLVDLQFRLGTDPTMWGSSIHMLYVGRKVA